MIPLYIYVEAPFAAFRTFTAGWYRPTATFVTPSAVYGLLLNLAGIESRLREGESGHDGKAPASVIQYGLPAAELAIGVPSFRLRGAADETTCPNLISSRACSPYFNNCTTTRSGRPARSGQMKPKETSTTSRPSAGSSFRMFGR